jgi:hypothetical protein
MSSNSWLAQLTGDDVAASGSPTGPGSSHPHEEEASGLNFRTAIEVHQKWKIRLQAAIEAKSEEELDPDAVSRDDGCELGQWIHQAGGRQFAGQSQFVDLMKKHAEFHLCAGRILSLAQSGQQALAVAEMAPGGEFARVSREVVGDLAAMFMRLKEVEARDSAGAPRTSPGIPGRSPTLPK